MLGYVYNYVRPHYATQYYAMMLVCCILMKCYRCVYDIDESNTVSTCDINGCDAILHHALYDVLLCLVVRSIIRKYNTFYSIRLYSTLLYYTI